MAKSKWEQVKDKLILIEGWARDGLTDEQIAKNLGIGKNTFYQYKKEHQDFSDSLKRGKEIVDYEVENALLKKALGYTITLKKEKVTKDGDVVKIKEEVHVPADTTAQIYWLNNRKPKQWKNKRIDTDIEQVDNSKDNMEQLTVEELKAIAYANINANNNK